MLFDDVNHLALSGDCHDALSRVIRSVVVCGRLQVDDLLALIDLHSQITSLALQLLVFTFFVFDLLSQLFLLRRKCLEAVSIVLLKLLHLALEALFVFLILFLVLSLDNFLCLFGHSVQLHVLRSLLIVLDFESISLHFILDLLKARVVLQDFHHVVHLVVSPKFDSVVFVINHSCADKDGVFVVCGDGLLRNFNLSLLEVDDELEVKLELFLAINSFGEL